MPADLAISLWDGDRRHGRPGPGRRRGHHRRAHHRHRQRPARRRDLDATGQIVSPGFIDIHTHYDAQVFWDPALTPSSYHGVTTVVAGNCGLSIAPTRAADRRSMVRILENVEDMNGDSLAAGVPWDFETFPEYLDAVRRHGTLLNYAVLRRPHPAAALRHGRGGLRAERSTPVGDRPDVPACSGRPCCRGGGRAVHQLRRHPSRRLTAGPSRAGLSDQAEFAQLCGSSATSASAWSRCPPGPQFTIEDMYRLQPAARGSVHLRRPAERHRAGVTTAWSARTGTGGPPGAEVWPQVTPLPVQVEFSMAEPGVLLSMNPAFQPLMGRAAGAERRAAYADPEWRAPAAHGFDRAGDAAPVRLTPTRSPSDHPPSAGRAAPTPGRRAGGDSFST